MRAHIKMTLYDIKQIPFYTVTRVSVQILKIWFDIIFAQILKIFLRVLISYHVLPHFCLTARAKLCCHMQDIMRINGPHMCNRRLSVGYWMKASLPMMMMIFASGGRLKQHFDPFLDFIQNAAPFRLLWFSWTTVRCPSLAIGCFREFHSNTIQCNI